MKIDQIIQKRIDEKTVSVPLPIYNMLVRKADAFNRLADYVTREAEAAKDDYLLLDDEIMCFTLTGMKKKELMEEVRCKSSSSSAT